MTIQKQSKAAASNAAWYHSVTNATTAGQMYIHLLFCVAKCLLGNPKPLNCIRWMRASRFCKTLFRHSAGVRSHHGTVMVTGIGIASQQANEHNRIFILHANLVFVRTKALPKLDQSTKTDTIFCGTIQKMQVTTEI